MVNDRLKAVVRRLPSNLSEAIFWKSVEPWVTAETVTLRSYHAGKLKTRPGKESVPSRAYIVFKNAEQVAAFSREYDGHLFRDKQGNESFAVVEFAPHQKVAPERKKHDTRSGTIHQDEDYLSFLQSLSADAEPEPQPSVVNNLGGPTSTPLLEALKAEKAAARDAASILSYHGHYSGADRRLATKAVRDAAKVVEEDASIFSRSNPVPPSVPAPVLLVNHKPEGKAREKGSKHRDPKGPLLSQSSEPKKREKRADAAVPASIHQSKEKNHSRGAQGKWAPSSVLAPKDAGASPADHPALDPPKERERKRPILNPRMFEAALAGVGASGARSRERRDQRASSMTAVDTEEIKTASASVEEVISSDKKTLPLPRGKNPGKGRNVPGPSNAEPSNPIVSSAPLFEAAGTASPSNAQTQGEPKTQTTRSRPTESPREQPRRGRGRGRGGRSGPSAGSQQQETRLSGSGG